MSEGISQRLVAIEEKLEQISPKPKMKIKPFKLKPSLRVKARNAYLKNKVLVFYLGTNRVLEPVIAKIKNNMVEIKDKMYDASLWFYFVYKMGKNLVPCLVIPEWKMTPIGTEDYEEAVKNNNVTEPQNIILRAIETAEKQMQGNKMSGKTWIWIILGLAVVGYILFGGGG